MDETKLLTICLFGRNDNYSPDFLYRINTAINFLANSANHIGRLTNLEVLVVDWGSKIPLKNTLTLSEQAKEITQFLFVPEIITNQYSSSGIPGNITMNIGMRRASGKLVGVCGADVIIAPAALQAIFSIIDGQSIYGDYQSHVYLCGRYNLPVDWVINQPSVAQWLEYLELNSWRIKQAPGRGSFLTGNAGLFLIPRNILYETGGLLEELDPGWGWNDVEYTVRISTRYKVIDLNSAGVAIYDMEHLGFIGDREFIFKKSAQRLLCPQYRANDDNWGAALINIPKESTYCLNDFIDYNSQLLIDENCSITENTLWEFSIWLSENVQLVPDENELEFLLILYKLMCRRNITYYKEYGVNQGVSFYLAAFLSKYCSLIGVDSWFKGGGELGPDHIAYNLTTPIMDHQGYVRLINKELCEGHRLIDDSEYCTNINGIVVYRLTEVDTLEGLLNELEHDFKNNILILIGRGHSHFADNIVSKLNTLSIMTMLSNHNGSVITNKMLKFRKVSTPEVQDLSILIKNGVNFSDLSCAQLVEKLDELVDRELILWGSGASIKLIVPHIKGKVVAIIEGDHLLMQYFSNLPIIKHNELALFPSALVVKI